MCNSYIHIAADFTEQCRYTKKNFYGFEFFLTLCPVLHVTFLKDDGGKMASHSHGFYPCYIFIVEHSAPS